VEFHRQAAKLIFKCSQSNLSEAITKAKSLKTSKNVHLQTDGKMVRYSFCPEKHCTAKKPVCSYILYIALCLSVFQTITG
jgi:hypothetical protein